MAKCGHKCEVYSRVCGYLTRIDNWNRGKKEEFKDRKVYRVDYQNKIPKKEAI